MIVDHTTLGLWILGIAIGAFLWSTRKRKPKGGCRLLRNIERLYRWRQAIEHSIGLESEQFLAMAATGAKVKQRILTDIRNRARAAEAERIAAYQRASLAFFGLDTVEIFHKRPLLRMQR